MKPILTLGVISIVVLSNGTTVVDGFVVLLTSITVSTGGIAVDTLVSSTVLSIVTVACEKLE